MQITTSKAIAIIVILGFLVFGNMLFNGFVWDDVPQIVKNPLYHSIWNAPQIFFDHTFTFYRPISAIVISFIYTIFGANPFWYHFMQISLHIINTIFIYIIFKKFIKNTIAFFISLIFLIHPMNVEAVSYISSIQIILSMTFGLSALMISLNKKISIRIKLILIFIFLLLSLLSKETGLIFILILVPFMAIVPQIKWTKKEYKTFGIVAISAVICFSILRFFITNSPIINDFSKSPVPIMQASIEERFITLPKTIYFYLQTFFSPKDLAISQNWMVKVIDVNNFIFPLSVDLLFFAAIIAPILYFVKKKKNPTKYLFFLTWFLFSWMIHWNIIPLDMTVAERWFYFAMVGLLGLGGVVINEFSVKKNTENIVVWVAIIIIFVLSIRTMIRNADWTSPINLYAHDLKISTYSYDLENSYAYELLLAKRYNEALPHIKKSIQLAPKFWTNWDSLGVYYEGKGEIDKSIDSFTIATKYNNNYYHAYFNIANLYFYRKTPKEAQVFLSQVLSKYPMDPQFLLLSGVTDYRLGDKESGMNKVLKAYNINKDSNLLNIYSEMQQDVKVE